VEGDGLMLTLWFVTGILAKAETTEPPAEPDLGGGSWAPSFQRAISRKPRKQRNREEIEALLLTSAI
jgi:hypothetical protein